MSSTDDRARDPDNDPLQEGKSAGWLQSQGGNASRDYEVSRRDFVKASLLTGATVFRKPGRSNRTAAFADTQQAASANAVSAEFTVNGRLHRISLDPRVSLLDALREHLGLTGAKKGCDHGQCGACTVLVNGRRILSCLSLAVVHQGDVITTIEGVAKGEELHPVQAAFLEYDGLQCGFCTPGQICSAIALMHEARRGDASFVTAKLNRTGPVDLTADEIRERMSGNICRCGAYPGILHAVESAYRKTQEETVLKGRA